MSSNEKQQQQQQQQGEQRQNGGDGDEDAQEKHVSATSEHEDVQAPSASSATSAAAAIARSGAWEGDTDEKWESEPEPVLGFSAASATVDSEDLHVYNSFDEMELNDLVHQGILSHGFEKPSFIQKKAIYPISKGRDGVIQSQSGTGKTGTFLISTMNRIDPALRQPQVMILSPTRELAEQTNAVALSLGGPMGLRTSLCIGGTSVRQNCEELDRGVHMVIGTPGRLLHLLEGNRNHRPSLHTSRLVSWVVDEADEMFKENFEGEMKNIFSHVPSECQVVVVSATMDEHVINLSSTICRNPIKVLVKKEEVTLEGIQQYFVDCEQTRFKPGVLLDLWDTLSVEQTIVFVNTKRDAETLCRILQKEGHAAQYVHSGVDCDREAIIQDFKNGKIRVLVATDLLARGIDIQTISTVINVDLPRDVANYIHRIGRCGRFGRKGVAINLVAGREMGELDRIRTYYETQIKTLPADLSLVFGN